MPSLLFFDYETTGLSPSRDRPVQFACVRTDLDLNIVGSPKTLHCKPLPDHLPDPAACLVSGITPQLCEEVGLPELAFVDEVQRELSVPGTISLGYDSIAFADEFTRFTFWRNLVDPYAHTWKNGCGRWDLIGLVRATYALRPGTLEWPRDDDGRVSFQLERLVAANRLLHESAHDALSDTIASLALARRLRELQPALYAHCFAMHDKTLALQEMDLEAKRPFVYVSRGALDSAGVRIMMPIAAHPTNRNEVIAWDLSADPLQLLDIDAETVRRRLFTLPEERPEGFEAMPIQGIAANRSPAVFADLKVLPRERALELGVDLDAALANVPVMLEVLEAGHLARLLQVVYEWDRPECDPEEALYAGFVGNADRRILERLRTLDAGGLATIKPEFSDPRLDELFLRYKARHFPEALSQRELDKWEEHRFDRLITGECGSRTVAEVRAAVASHRQALASASDLVPAGFAVLDDVLAYTNRLAKEIDPFGAVEPEAAAEPPAPPAPEAPAEAPAPASPIVQPDLFGGKDVTATTRRPRAGRRRPGA